MSYVLKLGSAILLFVSPLLAQIVPTIDIGSIRAVREQQGWRISSSSQVSRHGNRLQAGDIVISVDGKSIADLNALGAAFLLRRAGLDADSAAVIRDGRRLKLDFSPPERLLSGIHLFYTFPKVKLYGKDEPLPLLTLFDDNGTQHTVDLRSRWSILRVGGLSCFLSDLAAYDEIAHTPGVNAIAVATGEGPNEVRRIQQENDLHFTTLLPRDTRKDIMEGTGFSSRILPAAGVPTYIVVDPDERVAFVSAGANGLRSAWQFYKSVVAMN